MVINANIKNSRISKGYTLEKLAELTGFTKGYLSKIERSTKTPPFATVQSIADALQIDLTELLDSHHDTAASKNIDLTKAVDTIADGWENSPLLYSFKTLLNSYKNKYMSPFKFKVSKGTTEMTTHDSEEFVYVLEGNIELNYEGRTYPLCVGDCFYLDARIKHNFTNRDEQPALLLAVHYNYRRF